MPLHASRAPYPFTVAEYAAAPLVAHVIHQLDVGGLENGLVNLINHIPPDRYRHAIICLKGYSDFAKRIAREGVTIVALNKREGHDLALYLKLFRTLQHLRPDIVHTRNLSAVEAQIVAAFTRTRARVHGEHGRDMSDLEGTNRKYILLRKAARPFVNHYITVSKDLENWMVSTIGAEHGRVSQIYNGVDSGRFYPRDSRCPPEIGPRGFFTEDTFVIGSVGRMARVKDFPTLIRAFLTLLDKEAASHRRLRLLIVGDGETRRECIEMLRQGGAQDLAWLPGERADIPSLMRAMDIFVLPSLAEGISNTILEAMSSGLPVVATTVGGNLELVKPGLTGTLVSPQAPDALAQVLSEYCRDPALLRSQGLAARDQIESRFSMEAMTNGYLAVYDKVLAAVG